MVIKKILRVRGSWLMSEHHLRICEVGVRKKHEKLVRVTVYLAEL
jgi:hypothetical protein